MLSFISPPRIASQKGTCTVYSASVPAALGRLLRRAAAAEHAGEDVAEAAAAAAMLLRAAKIKVAEVELHMRAALATLAALVVAAEGIAAGAERIAARGAAVGVGFGRLGIDVVRVEAELVVDLALLGVA